MTTDDIIRMAREAWGSTDPSVDSVVWYQNLKRFAFLVRDQMISDGWRQCAQGQKTSQFCGMVEQEREGCAIAGGAAADAGLDVAAAIRARGQPINEDNPSF